MLGEGKSPKKISFNLDNITSPEEEKYKTTNYFGKKPSMAILTNIGDEADETDETVTTAATTTSIKNNETSIYNNINEPKRYYLVDDGKKQDKNVPDTYLIKTLR